MFRHLFMFLSLIFTLTAFAAEIPVMEVKGARYYNNIDTKIKVDLSSGEGSVRLKLSKKVCTRGGCRSRPILSKEAKVEGLFLQGDKLIFRGEAADVDCGTMGVSRVFKIPTLFLSGKCDVKVVESGRTLKVLFVTK